MAAGKSSRLCGRAIRIRVHRPQRAVYTVPVDQGHGACRGGRRPELLDKLDMAMFGPGTGFPPPDAPPGYLTHITIDKVGGVGPWAS